MNDYQIYFPQSSLFFKSVSKIIVEQKIHDYDIDNEFIVKRNCRKDFFYNGYIDLVAYENDLSSQYYAFKQEMVHQVPFSIINNKERYQYYYDLYRILSKFQANIDSIKISLSNLAIHESQANELHIINECFPGLEFVKDSNRELFWNTQSKDEILINVNDFVRLPSSILNSYIDIQEKYIVEAAKLLTGLYPNIIKLEGKGMKWKASTPILGYIFMQLVEKGFIEPPLFQGGPNFSGLGEAVCSLFEMEPTEYNKKQFNENSNALSDTKRNKFTIPEAIDLK